MDFKTATRGTVRWSESQKRYELNIFEGVHHLWGWTLSAAFTSPAAESTGKLFGVEEINFHLSQAQVKPSGAGAWKEMENGGWEREIFTTHTSADKIW